MTSLPRSVADALDSVTYRQRALAYLQVDAALVLVSAGGNLENYGLSGLQPGHGAVDQAFFLEGLLPPPEIPFLLPSLEFDGGRAADVHFYEDGEFTWVVLLDVTAERDRAQRMQQQAYDVILLQEKEALLNRRLEETNAALTRTHEHLQRELAEAAGYVRSQLPTPLSEPFKVDWRFVPFAQLGGDSFGYSWLDPDHFALYLLDVCGHGVGPSLMSIAVLQLLRATSLQNVDFRDPSQVLAALNDRFEMKEDDDLYFTLWYGVYHPASRRLDFSSGGHPPAVLTDAAGKNLQMLRTKGAAIGFWPGTAFPRDTVTVPIGSRLYLFSDGAYEVERPDGTMMSLEELADFISSRDIDGKFDLDLLFRHLLQVRGGAALDDDFSIVRFAF
jgi:sigma-B regulation protein RsbU (phosphoserine phosphatase)